LSGLKKIALAAVLSVVNAVHEAINSLQKDDVFWEDEDLEAINLADIRLSGDKLGYK